MSRWLYDSEKNIAHSEVYAQRRQRLSEIGIRYIIIIDRNPNTSIRVLCGIICEIIQVEDTGFFQNELFMMSVTLPRMNEILHSFNLPALSARCFHVQLKTPTYLVIEDLAPKGFQMPHRHVGLDLDHCILAIRNVARFHASSIALKEKVIRLAS